MKRIMSGRKFCSILRYLHVCSMDATSTGDTYDPVYKVAEMKDYLEQRFDRLFEPAQQLSLDETLIRSFGRISFKVRIISKSARYGIKRYVLTDAITAYVIKVIIYTGKYTYQESDNQKEKKTVQIVKQLCRKLEGTHRTIYIDRFYTSIDLVKELRRMDLYVTGTVMKNRIPKELTVTKSSKMYKEMGRGDFKRHRFVYLNGEEEEEMGLVCWKDWDVVYWLSNNTDTVGTDTCKRRSKDGLLTLTRPTMIAEYNKYMGGVDLADMRRLHCNSTIMGQNRWWLKLFFYLLDVGTSNALVLYKLVSARTDVFTIVDFKGYLVQAFLGNRLQSVPEAVVSHFPTSSSGRNRCVHCAIFSRVRRTRFHCSAPDCQLPLCLVGSGQGVQDCFSLCHGNPELLAAALIKYQAMKKKVNRRFK